MSALDTLLKRERACVAVAFALLTLLAWLHIWRGAGMGMPALQMTSLALFPHAQAEPMAEMVPPAFAWSTVIAMWWVMMIAMMMPSAAPLLFLYDRVLRQAGIHNRSGRRYASPAFLVAGYLAMWLAFSVAAAALQYTLHGAGLISEMMLWSRSALLSASVLIGAGIYQLSPLKHACREHCRGPVEFLAHHRRPGPDGAFIMGLEHGLWCVGCCWALMLLLFVGGVMNLAWIALLALLVLAEKVVRKGAVVSRIAGGVLIAWGLATLAV